MVSSDVIPFKARTSPRSIYTLLQELSDQQKEAVRDIGLGSILHLSISHCPVHISKWLLLNFDVHKRCIVLHNGDNIVIDEEDVEAVFNLPRGPVHIVESLGHDKGDVKYNDFLRQFRARWRKPTGGPTTGEMLQRLMESKAGDEHFKVDFAILFVSLMVWGGKNQTCRYKILKSLMDVETIPKLNWCSFTFNALLTSIAQWKLNQKSHFDGPMTFLLVIFDPYFYTEQH